MKKSSSFALAAWAVLLALPRQGGCDVPYFPYETIDQYYGNKPAPPPPGEPQAAEPAPERPVKPLEPPEGAIRIGEAPEFLFPKELGFGVAVGVPYDLFYVDKSYYLARGSSWYRAPSYKGPWRPVGYGKLPPALRKQKLARIRSIRNREFALYWKDKEKYRGRRFRPGDGTEESPAVR